ncbi:MAG: SDR family oxidoreductase [Treponema sp.]|nr:SDR family oxidoreductase [Treponema sp.]
MDLNFKGKIAVVTGAGKGIGFKIAEEFLKEGAEVFICARNREELKAAETILSISGKVHTLALDGTKESSMELLAKEAASVTGSIDAWVNNIGTNKKKAGQFYTEEELDYIISANFKSCVFGTQAAVKYMKQNGGSIVNISSLAAHAATANRSSIYAGMKAAVLAYTRTAAAEYAPYNIRVNAVLPGYTRTPLVMESFSKESLDELLKNNILNRMAEPYEIAKPVVFLSSPAASYITAAELEVTGGHIKVLNARECHEIQAES